MRNRDQQVWNLVRKIEIANNALKDVLEDPLFRRQVGVKSINYTDLMHDRASLLALLALFSQQARDVQSTPDNQEDLPW